MLPTGAIRIAIRTGLLYTLDGYFSRYILLLRWYGIYGNLCIILIILNFLKKLLKKSLILDDLFILFV